jgi:hypothetical protein
MLDSLGGNGHSGSAAVVPLLHPSRAHALPRVALPDSALNVR